MTTWRGTRACRGCDGSGFDYRNPDTSTWESFHDCLCCDGTGRQAERMPIADAMADAETLRLFAWGCGLERIFWLYMLRDATIPEGYFSNMGWAPELATLLCRKAAHAAFRAVPGLRGEK